MVEVVGNYIMVNGNVVGTIHEYLQATKTIRLG